MSNLIQPGWSINAFFYELLQSKLIHSIDGYIIGELSGQGILDKDSVRGVDFGSGTGDLTLKIARDLLQRGRTDARVYSVENDPLMNEKLKTRLRKLESRSHTRGIERLISPIRGNLYGPIIDTIATETQGIDFAIFKRCLYSDKEKVKGIIKRTYDQLKPDGNIFIVHPEADFNTYCDNGFGKLAPLHVMRWAWAQLGKELGLVEYQRYTQSELVDLCQTACPDANIKRHFPQRPAYNLVQIQKAA